MRHPCLPALLAVLCLVASASAAAEPGGDPPWGRSFADADATRAAAADVPVDEEFGIVVLFEGARFVFDDDGRLERRYRLVYRIDAESSIRGWSSVSRSWNPWHQRRPDLRARVLAPDGSEAWLAPENLSEYADDSSGPDVYGDTMTYKGPLPTLKVGAIVEEEHLVADTEPAFDAGSTYRFVFGRTVPVRMTRATIDAPAELPLRHKLFLLPDAVEVEERVDGRVRIVIEQGPMPARKEVETHGPGDFPRYPSLRIATAASWNAVAARYHEMVEERLADADLRKLAKKAVGREKDREKIIAALLEEVQQRVRYTGIEFGEQAIVPTSPLQTLERGFGDCKDKATLLVGLLRAQQIPAYVALLDSGTGFDVDLDLPGMGQFDHAIVYVPGPPELWIDPTHRFARAGELPVGDQRRRALVAAPTTESPTLTPVATPEQNLRRQRREVYLALDGGARIVETTEVHGVFDQSYRSSYSGKKDSDLREHLEKYVKSQYLAEALAEMEVSSIEDLSGPLRIRLEASECRRATTGQTEATVYIPVGSVFSSLPGDLRPDQDREDEDAGALRESPLLLTRPYVEEWDYRIFPPAGYVARHTPEDSVESIGPATLTRTFAVEDDGTVSATISFDTVKDAYSPEEVLAVREALAALYEGTATAVTFQAVGETLLAAGSVKEALAEFRRLSAAYPDEPRHHAQAARAYLAAGLGSKAREEARRAVALAPDSPVAFKVLGLVLAHDLLGRKFVDGFDRPGAEAALRRAIELVPDDFEANGELAILLEHDDEGQRYGPGASLDEAIAGYEKIRTELESEQLTTNLMVVLAHAGRWPELRAVSEEAPRTGARDALRVAAFAAEFGADRAQEEANRLTGGGGEYRTVLLGAADWLAATRMYAPAADLMTVGAKGASDAVPRLTRARILRTLVRHETADMDLGTPEGLVHAFLRDMIESTESVERTVAQLPARSLRHIDRDELTDRLLETRRSIAWAMRQEGTTIDQMLDGLLAPGGVHVTRSEHGFRVRLQEPASHSTWLAFYVVQDGERLRVLGMTDLLPTVGEWVLGLEEDGELDAARQWLDWLREDVAGEPTPDPLVEHPIRKLWRPDGPRDALRIRLAAATLMTPPHSVKRQLELLDAGADADLSDSERAGLEVARFEAADRAGRYDLALQSATYLSAAFPDSIAALVFHAGALAELERFDEADRLIVARRARQPDNPTLRALYSDLPSARKDLDEWRKRLTAEIETGTAMPGVYNNLAWLDIVEQQVDEETLGIAQEGAVRDNYSTPALLHTLATVFAEMGYVNEARDVVLALLNNRDTSDLESPDWYILGRIAEEYRAPEAAREYYANIEPPDEPNPASTFQLAVRRLESMDREAKKQEAP